MQNNTKVANTPKLRSETNAFGQILDEHILYLHMSPYKYAQMRRKSQIKINRCPKEFKKFDNFA